MIFSILILYQLFLFREEEEYEESDPGVQSTKSNNPRSIDDNNPSQAASVGRCIVDILGMVYMCVINKVPHSLMVW